MDNDNKIIRTKDATKLFLKETGNFIGDEANIYNIETELAKTKKVKNLRYKFLLTLFIILMLTVSYSIAKAVEESGKNFTMSIEEFNDVNLRDILASAKRNENQITTLENDLKNIIYNRDRSIESLRIQTQREIDTIAGSDLTGDIIEQKIAVIQAGERARRDQIVAQFDIEIRNKQIEIDQLRESLESMDQNSLSSARESQGVLDSNQQILEIKLEQQRAQYEHQIAQINQANTVNLRNTRSYYENRIRILNENHQRNIEALILKYNPLLLTGNIKQIIDNTTDLVARQTDSYMIDPLELRSITSAANQTGIDMSFITEADQRGDKIKTLIQYLNRIGYSNSIPLIISHISVNVERIISFYRSKYIEAINKVFERDTTIATRDETINRLNSQKNDIIEAISLVNSNGNPPNTEQIVGYILKSNDIFNISILTLDSFTPTNLQAVSIYRGSEKIGTAIINIRSGKVFAQQGILTRADRPINSFDRITIAIRR